MVRGSPGRGSYMKQSMDWLLKFARDDVSYSEACEAWARSLDRVTVESYAADYMRGMRDPATIDGYEEALRRWPGRTFRKTAEGSNKGRPRKPRCQYHEGVSVPKNCADCKQLQQFELEARVMRDEPGAIIPDAPQATPISEPDDEAMIDRAAIKDAPMTLADALALASSGD